MALAHCILGKFSGVGCHCFPLPLDIPTFSARCLHVQRCARPLAAESGTLRGREMFQQISSRIRLPRNSRDLLHAANRRHGTDGFTSPPKEGVLRIFSPLKIWRLRPGLNPWTWIPKASTLPLDHRRILKFDIFASCCSFYYAKCLSKQSTLYSISCIQYNVLKRSLMICNPQQILFGCTNQDE
jgi:hypothetical protein